MVWGKAGSTTLTSAGDDVDITSLAEGTNRMIMSHMINSGACQNKVTFNDTGSSKYASRNEYNDDADSTQVNQNFVPHWDGNDNASNDQFVVSFLSDIDGEEKLGLYWGIDRGTAGTNTIRSRNMVYKYINTPKITRLDLNNQGAGSYDTGSNFTVLGSDLTPAAAIPALDNVQDNSLFVDKVNARRYWFTPQTVDTEEAFSFTTTDTVNALWGNRIYGMKLLSGHSGLNKYIKKIKTYHPTNPTGSRLTTGTLYHVILDSSGTEIARSAGVSASSVSNNSWAETTLSSPVKLEENYTVGVTISTGSGSSYLGTAVNNNGSSPTNTTRYYKDESGNVGLSTSETMLMVFDSDPATGISIPSTWTMQPTKQFDFSSSTGWTTVGSNITITGGAITANAMVTQTDNRIYYDLGSALSDKFVIDFDHYADSSPANSFWQMFALTDTTAIPRTDDGIYPLIDMGSWDTYLRYSNEGSETNVGTLGSLTEDVWQYVRFVRDGTTGTLTVYSDSARTTQVLNVSGTIPATVTGLRYFQSGSLSGANSGTATYKIDNLKIYDGVTSVN